MSYVCTSSTSASLQKNLECRCLSPYDPRRLRVRSEWVSVSIYTKKFSFAFNLPSHSTCPNSQSLTRVAEFITLNSESQQMADSMLDLGYPIQQYSVGKFGKPTWKEAEEVDIVNWRAKHKIGCCSLPSGFIDILLFFVCGNIRSLEASELHKG